MSLKYCPTLYLTVAFQNINMEVVMRMYLALVLFTLLKETNLWSVAEKFQLSRGFVQTLLSSASAFCSCVLHFTEVSASVRCVYCRCRVLQSPITSPLWLVIIPLCLCSGAGGVLALQSSADRADTKAELLCQGWAHSSDGSGRSHGGQCGGSEMRAWEWIDLSSSIKADSVTSIFTCFQCWRNLPLVKSFCLSLL